MFLAKDSLVKFSNAIINEAEEQKRRLFKKITEENALLIKNKKAELENLKNDYVREEIEKIENTIKLKISSKNHELKCELIKKRHLLLSSVFDKVKENILDYTKTEEYKQKLEKVYLNSINLFDDMIVEAKEYDIEYLKSLSSKEIVFKPTDDDILGGIILTIPKQRILIDYSFKTKLEEAVNNFVLTSGFIID